jgi:hypothetical protein
VTTGSEFTGIPEGIAMFKSFCAGSALVLLTLSATAQDPKNLLDRAKAEQSLLVQKLEGEMRSALTDARRLQEVSKPRAIAALRSALLKLEDPLVPPAFRNDWTARLNAQIKSVESGQKIADPVAVDPAKREIREANAKKAKAIQEEYTEVRRSLDTISALVKSGNSAQAQKESEALAKRYPDNPAVILMGENSAMNQRLSDARVLIEQQKQGFVIAMRSLDKSSIAPKDDIEFDAKRFQEITKLRMKPLLTKKEQQILKALDSPTNLGYKDAPFEEVIKAISTSMGQEILLDKTALESAMITTATPVSVTLRGITARTALRKVLQDQNLTYIIRNESIQVVTPETARNTLVTRVYYVGDLVQLNGPFAGAINWGPWLDMMQVQENINKLIEMIKAIDPLSWQGAGGMGTVTFNGPSMALIVRQTAEMHARLSGSLGR